MKHPGKLQMHWLGLYLIHSITSGGAVQLQQLDGAVLQTLINGSHLNPYMMVPEMRTAWGTVKKKLLLDSSKARLGDEAVQG